MAKSSDKSLKSMNRKMIWSLIILDMVLLTVCLHGIPFELPSFLSKSGIALLLASTVGPMVAGFLNEFISSPLKASLVFWRLREVLPGHRAFSKIVHTDPRIDVSALQQKLGAFPTDARGQNQLWYRLYRKHEDDIRVQDTHQSFLLYRDCASLTCLMGLVVIVLTFFLNVADWQRWILSLGIVLQYLSCVLAARNTGVRFVQSVLVAESVENK